PIQGLPAAAPSPQTGAGMINRLLEQLDNPRRHLTFLVGLLALVFVLTTVVAWRANAAARDRARIALSTLDETAGAALEVWSLLSTTFAGNRLPYLAGGMVDPALTASALLERVQDLDTCPECGTPTRVRSALVTDLSTGVFRDAGDPV